MSGMSPINRALTAIPKRAESRQAEELRATFVDSGVADAMRSVDHQVIYGRRGTGKTHALRYLEGVVHDVTNLGVYVDLRTVGSPEGLFLGERVGITERAGRLLRDLLYQIYDALLAVAIEDDALVSDKVFTTRLDKFLDAVGSVGVDGTVEAQENEGRKERRDSERSVAAKATSSGPSGFLKFGRRNSGETVEESRVIRRGEERVALNFSDVAKALRELAESYGARRIWLLLDEWSSVPTDVQPYLAEFLVRCVLPVQIFTVKIAAIEQQSVFSVTTSDGQGIGIEVGADVSANLDLDDFMVFEQGSERARDFFQVLFHKHLTSGLEGTPRIDGLATSADLVRLGFTDRRAFDELVRAAEGVPRDAINIAGKAALKATEKRISVPDVRAAARSWFQQDKEAALQRRDDAQRLLSWIIDNVIRGKRARAFLVNRRDSRTPLLMALFEARVLHLIRRGYSAQDEPGERYDVFSIDYGAYVDLIQTKYEPKGLLATDAESEYVEVPTQDLRAIRRSILDLDDFESTLPI